MLDYRAVERQLTSALSLNRRPVAVAFRSSPPPDVAKFSGTEPSGCSFWRLAASKRAFYTVPADHHNCPIGSYTHSIPLPPERAAELPQTLSLMTELGYLTMEEVPGIPRLPESPGVVIYVRGAPAGRLSDRRRVPGPRRHQPRRLLPHPPPRPPPPRSPA